MNDLQKLDLCYKIAEKAHAGQERRDGSDYIAHPKRVASLLSNQSIKIVCMAWLHDVLEDTKETAQSLLNQGVSKDIVYGVICLTKLPDTMQTYKQYINKISKDPDAVRVKLADMMDNLCDEPTKKQRDKYKSAMKTLWRGLK